VAGYPSTGLYVELLNLGIEIVEDWYSVGNIEHDVSTLRFEDFIHMVNFFWVVCLSVTVLGNHYIWIL
jgi:hypothetical protein